MEPRRIGGIALIVVGAAVAFSGYQLSNTIGEQIGSAITGSPTDSVTWRYVVGAVCAAVGAFLAR